MLRKPTRRRTYIILCNIVTAANLPLLSSPYPPPRRQNLPSKTRARSGGRAEITPPPSSAAIVAGVYPYMAAVAPVPWWPPPALAPAGLLLAAATATPPRGNTEPQTLPFFLPPPPLPLPPPPGYPLLPPRGPIVLQLHYPHPSFVAEVDRRRSCSLLQVSQPSSPPGEVQLHLAHILLPPSFECMIRLRAFFFSFAPYTMRDAAVEG
jgi:hypothetical protein